MIRLQAGITRPVPVIPLSTAEGNRCHHTRQQLALGIGHTDAYIIGMRERVGLHALLYTSASKTAVDGIYLNNRRGASTQSADFGLGDGDLNLYGRDVEDAYYSLRRHSRFARAHKFATDDAANGGDESAVGQILLSHFVLRLSLSHLALYLDPLHLGQRSVVVQHLVALQSIVGLGHLSLSTAKQVASLGVVHLGYQLSAAHSLTFVHQHALNHTHASKAYCSSLTLFDNAYISLSVGTCSSRCYLCFNSNRSLSFLFLFTSTAAYQHRAQQHQNTLVHV